jgi:hypothetical protein
LARVVVGFVAGFAAWVAAVALLDRPLAAELMSVRRRVGSNRVVSRAS